MKSLCWSNFKSSVTGALRSCNGGQGTTTLRVAVQLGDDNTADVNLFLEGRSLSLASLTCNEEQRNLRMEQQF